MEKEKFMNHVGYTDVTPYEILRWVSEKTVEIREMRATLNPDWKPEVIPGGFVGNCANQATQKWLIESDESKRVIRARLGKKGWKSKYGFHCLSDKPKKFYDFNF